MHRSYPRAALRKSIFFGVAAWLLGGCSLLMPPPDAARPVVVEAPAAPDPKAPRLAALETRHVELEQGQELIGETQVIFARYENTFPVIGREFNLGYEEMRRANPGVDQWLPGEGTPIYLPTQSILPEGSAHGHRRQRAGHAALLLHDREARAGGRPARSSKSPAIRSASASRAGRHRSAKGRSRGRRATPSGTCRRRSARSTPSAAIRCRASCRPAPTIRSVRTR